MPDPGPLVAVVPSGFICSSAFTIFPAYGTIAIECPASVATTVNIQFTRLGPTTATSADFFTYQKYDGSGGAFIVSSGPGWGTVPYPATAVARIRLGATSTMPFSFTVSPRMPAY